MDESPIVRVIRKYYPDFEAPEDRGKEWVKVLCPFHGESNPSASISYEHDAFVCRACGVKGDVYSIIMQEEEVSFAEAKRLSEGIFTSSHEAVPDRVRRQSGRRVFEHSGATGSRSKVLRSRVRREPPPWS